MPIVSRYIVIYHTVPLHRDSYKKILANTHPYRTHVFTGYIWADLVLTAESALGAGRLSQGLGLCGCGSVSGPEEWSPGCPEPPSLTR